MAIILYLIIALLMWGASTTNTIDPRSAGFIGIILFNMVLWFNRGEKLPKFSSGPLTVLSDWRIEMIAGIACVAVVAMAIFLW